MIASVRAIVEHSFVWMKAMGYRRVRYLGRRRNELDFALTLIAYSWKRSLSLAARRPPQRSRNERRDEEHRSEFTPSPAPGAASVVGVQESLLSGSIRYR